jgi:hypothetical protein
MSDYCQPRILILVVPAGTALLKKPFTKQRLLLQVREVLAAAKTS